MVEKSESESETMQTDEEVEDQRTKVNEGASTSEETSVKAKKKKRGIIYLSTIPKHMNVTILREMLSQYATVGRIFLQPEKLPSGLTSCQSICLPRLCK